MAARFAEDPDIAAAALYHLAWSDYWMNGTMSQCVTACSKLIANYLDSSWRPEAIRLLANAHYALGEHDDALSTLAMLRTGYPNTTWEHYADMRPASIWEYGKGDPQKALEIYQQTLRRHPDQLYAPYINNQIERLRKVIEGQLIQDALDGLAKADLPECKNRSVIVKTTPQTHEQMAAKF
jgi:tetratricopeptide (TPR) repeat protein